MICNCNECELQNTEICEDCKLVQEYYNFVSNVMPKTDYPYDEDWWKE